MVWKKCIPSFVTAVGFLQMSLGLTVLKYLQLRSVVL